RGRGTDRHRAALRRQRSGRPALASRDGRRAAQFARREGALPRLVGAGAVQREFAVGLSGAYPALILRSDPEDRVSKDGNNSELVAVASRPPQDEDRSHGLSATAFFTASMNSGGGGSFAAASGLPVSSRLFRLERIFGQPISPPLRISRGTSHECDSDIV